MPTMPSTEQILGSIERCLDELRAELDALTAARAELDGGGAQSRKRPRRSARSTRSSRSEQGRAGPESRTSSTEDPSAKPAAAQARRSTRSRRATRKPGRSAKVVPAGKLELLLSECDGLTTASLAERANGRRDQVLTLLRELEAAGRVRRSGQRRATRWHVITDDERIEQRAAELAASRKRPT
jgi:hypothetical protein